MVDRGGNGFLNWDHTSKVCPKYELECFMAHTGVIAAVNFFIDCCDTTVRLLIPTLSIE